MQQSLDLASTNALDSIAIIDLIQAILTLFALARLYLSSSF